MVALRAGMVKTSSNAPIIVLGRAIETAAGKTLAEMRIKIAAKIITSNPEIRKILGKISHLLGRRKTLLDNICLRPRAIRPCRNPLYLRLNHKAATQIIEMPIKMLLAEPIPTRIAPTEAAVEVNN